MIRVQIKPLSVNQAWRGRRIKTKDYTKYEKDLGLLLPAGIDITGELHIDFGLSSRGGDIDNGVKPFLDILQKKYGFNDNAIYKLIVTKTIVPKGEEYIDFEFV